MKLRYKTPKSRITHAQSWSMYDAPIYTSRRPEKLPNELFENVPPGKVVYRVYCGANVGYITILFPKSIQWLNFPSGWVTDTEVYDAR